MQPSLAPDGVVGTVEVSKVPGRVDTSEEGSIELRTHPFSVLIDKGRGKNAPIVVVEQSNRVHDRERPALQISEGLKDKTIDVR